MCEVLNRQLIDGRDKPIITCLEFIRHYLMKRIANVQNVIDKTAGPLTPNATKLLENIKREASDYIVEWNGGNKYEVKGPWNDQVVVDMSDRTCSCRKWELTGIPCKHVVATLWYMASNGATVDSPERLVHPCYYLETWKAVYSYKVNPTTSSLKWPKSVSPTTLVPPDHHTQPGRPKKKRKKSADEMSQPLVREGRLRRSGMTVKCTKCNQLGHNSRGCKVKEVPSQKSQSTKQMTCAICKMKGHNSRGCKSGSNAASGSGQV